MSPTRRASDHRESKGQERAARSWKADKRRSLRRRCTLCSAPVGRPFRTLRLARRRCNGTTVASSRCKSTQGWFAPASARENEEAFYDFRHGWIAVDPVCLQSGIRSEEHKSEHQQLTLHSYAVLCMIK